MPPFSYTLTLIFYFDSLSIFRFMAWIPIWSSLKCFAACCCDDVYIRDLFDFLCVCVYIILFHFISLYFRFFTIVLHLSHSTLLLLDNLFHINVVVLFIHSFISFFFFFFFLLLLFFSYGHFIFSFSLCVCMCVCVWVCEITQNWNEKEAQWHVNRSECVEHYLACLPVCMHAFWLARLSCYGICACARGFCVHVQ